MSLLGHPRKGASTIVLAENQLRVTRFTAPSDLRVPKLVFYLDGEGLTGAQEVRAALYRVTGLALLAVSDPVVIPVGTDAAWVDFPLDEPGGIELEAGEQYEYGIHGGITGDNVRLRGDSGGTGATVTDAYADGTPNPRAAGSANTTRLSGFAVTITPYEPPEIDDISMARLPFPETQRIFGAVAAPHIDRGRIACDCGWHGTITDPEQGAFALVQSGSNCEMFVGDRVRVTNNETGAEVYVYCIDEQADLPTEISLTRRAFMALSSPADTAIPVTVEELA